MASKVTADVFLQAAKTRRTIYALNKTLTVSPARVTELVQQAVLHAPSSFNQQTTRAIVLFGAEHDKLWDITSDALKAIVPEDRWQATASRIAGFKAGAGSVLFFEDQDAIKATETKFAAYADKIAHWAAQGGAIAQYLTWTALELEGLGANLQHYTPLIDAKVAEAWKVPATWKLDAQLVFGGKAAEAGEKTFVPIEERVKVHGN